MRQLMMGLAIFVFAVGCSDPTGPERPTDAERFQPPPSYEVWYEVMERCSGIDGDFSRVRWFVVAGTSWESAHGSGDRAVGQWWPPHDVYVAEARMHDRDVVTHEILHELLQAHDHPEPPFGECAPLSVGRPDFLHSGTVSQAVFE